MLFGQKMLFFTVCFGVCNRAAVVDGGDVRVSPHSRLRRQCGVIEFVTAPRLISPDIGCALTVGTNVGAYRIRPKKMDDRHQTIFTIPLRWVRAYAMPPIAQPQSGCNLNNPMLTISEAQSATGG